MGSRSLERAFEQGTHTCSGVAVRKRAACSGSDKCGMCIEVRREMKTLYEALQSSCVLSGSHKVPLMVEHEGV